MLIAQISDLHLSSPGTRTLGVAPMAENLAACINAINRFEPAPALVLVTGDVTHTGTMAETRRAADLLGELKIPFYVVPGNHDERDCIRQVFGPGTGSSGQGEFLTHVIGDHPLRLIGLDTTIPGQPGGRMCAHRLNWLDERLREDSRPTLLFMHHPPLRMGIGETDLDGFDGAGKLGDLVEQAPHVLGLACGHVHLPVCAPWHGALLSTSPGMGMGLVLDLTMGAPSSFVLEPPAFQLHNLTPEGNLVTHTVYVRPLEGPYSF